MTTCNLILKVSPRRGFGPIIKAINAPLLALGMRPVVPKWMLRVDLSSSQVEEDDNP